MLRERLEELRVLGLEVFGEALQQPIDLGLRILQDPPNDPTSANDVTEPEEPHDHATRVGLQLQRKMFDGNQHDVPPGIRLAAVDPAVFVSFDPSAFDSTNGEALNQSPPACGESVDDRKISGN